MTLKEYKAELTYIFRCNTTRGFADWRQCGNLAYNVEDFLDRAAKVLLREYRDKELFDLVCTAYLKWAKTDKDDSNGETQGFIYYSVFEIWNKIYEREHPDIPHTKMMDWFLKKMDGSVIDYMEDFLLEYMMAHFKEPKLLEKKIAFLNGRIAAKTELVKEKSWEVYDIYRCKDYILQIYGEQKRPIEEIRAYAKELQRNDSRELLAKIELEYGNQDECLRIYEALADAVERHWDREDYNGKLKDLYKQFGMQEKYAAQVKRLLGIKIGHMDIWEEYKALIPVDDWTDTVNQLFSTFAPGDCRPLTWYEEEGRYDLIMTGVEHGGPTYLEHYEGELIQRYPERCLAVLVKAADDSAERGKKRSDYRYIAKYLKWMMRYPGGREKAATLAETYRKQYPRRSAMLDELRGI